MSASTNQSPGISPQWTTDCAIELFDFHVTRTWESIGQTAPGTSAKSAPSDAEAVILAKGLFQLQWPWGWCTPGPRDGPFASYDGNQSRSLEFGAVSPNHPPCTIKVVREGDAKASRVGQDADVQRMLARLEASLGGWGQISGRPWRHDAGYPFPGLMDSLQSRPDRWDVTLKEGMEQVDVWDGHDGGARKYPGLPFVLASSGTGSLVLNPDTLDEITIVLAAPQFDEVLTLVDEGRIGWGSWSGVAVVRLGEKGILLFGPRRLHLASVGEPRLEALRFQHALGMTFREARIEWQWRLPPVGATHWRRSEVHRTLRAMLPGIARQSLREAWDETRRQQVMRRAVDLVLGCRLALTLFWKAEEEMQSQAVSQATEDGWDNETLWPLFEFGVRDIDPVSLWTLASESSLDREGVEDLARRYQEIPGLWAPGISRALVHGLLLFETGQYLSKRWRCWRQSGQDLTLLTLNRWAAPQYRDHIALVNLEKLQARQLHSRAWGSGLEYWITVFGGGALGAWIGGMRGGVLGLILAVLLDAAWTTLSPRGSEKRTPLIRSMLAAVNVSAQPAGWAELELCMHDAAREGAAWSPLAWRLVAEGRRREARAPDVSP